MGECFKNVCFICKKKILKLKKTENNYQIKTQKIHLKFKESTKDAKRKPHISTS